MGRNWASSFVAGILAASCHRSTTPPNPPTATDVRELESTRSGTSVALMGVRDDKLGRIGCYDAEARTVLTNERCLLLVPAGSQVRFSDGSHGTVTGRGKLFCGPECDAPPALVVDAPHRARFAIWPADAIAEVHEIEPQSKHARVWLVDLDGDHRPERITVSVHDGDVFDLRATFADASTVTITTQRSMIRSISTIDLDGDGRPELLVDGLLAHSSDGGRTWHQ